MKKCSVPKTSRFSDPAKLNMSQRLVAAASLAIAMSFCSNASATVVNVVGVDGTFLNPDGGAAIATADSTTDQQNEATATGGAGYGRGSGGYAKAIAGSTLASSYGPVEVSAAAYGGTGYYGGNAFATANSVAAAGYMTISASAVGGKGRSVSGGLNGDGGIGGFGSVVQASGVNNTQPSQPGDSQFLGSANTILVRASSTGGDGGTGRGNGFTGGAGGAAYLNQVSGVSSWAGYTKIVANATGGTGGYGMAEANGGNGGNVIITNAVTGSTDTSNLTIAQNATGGNSGGTDGGTSAGLAGNASSSLTLAFPLPSPSPNLQASVGAYAGSGGNLNNVVGSGGTGTAGTADAVINLKNVNAVFATANANNGTQHGSNLIGGSGIAGNGNYASANAQAISTGLTGTAAATANAFGSNGGSVIDTGIGDGGNGGAATAQAYAQDRSSINRGGTTPATEVGQSVAVNVKAVGGNGGQGSGAGNVGGNGGTANLGPTSGVSTGGGNVAIEANIIGGNGGYGASGAGGGNGANASVAATNAIGGSTSGQLTLTQHVTGGNSGGTSGGANAGVAGNASSYLTLAFTPTSSATPSLLNGQSIAFGGNGGYVTNGTSLTNASSQAGTATAQINLTNVGNVIAIAGANGLVAPGEANTSAPIHGSNVLSGASDTGGGALASAASTAISSGTAGYAQAIALAYGSNGGGISNKDYMVASGDTTGNGGSGGNATAGSTAQNASTSDTGNYEYKIFNQSVISVAQAIGGNGGAGQGTGYAGGNGGGASISFASGTSSGGGAVTISATGIGGNGGYGYSGAAGGSGGDATLTGTFTGNTSGVLTLDQMAAGGMNGGTSGYVSAGSTGSATSVLDFAVPAGSTVAPSTLIGSSSAYSGGVFRLPAGPANLGPTTMGSANASISLSSINNVSATASANGKLSPLGGTNGFAAAVDGVAAAGASSSADAAAVSTGTSGGYASASATAYGLVGTVFNGTAGNGGNGGDATAQASGENASKTNTLPYSASQFLPAFDASVSVDASAYAGNGGRANGTGYHAGNGGAATVAGASGTSTGGGNVTISAIASAGNGGYGATGSYGGNGGSATIGDISGVSTGSGNVVISAIATAGYGGRDGTIGNSGNGGIATINGVSGSSSGNGNVELSAVATGGRGASESLINTVSGSTSGELWMLQRATAGGASSGELKGSVGAAGNANATMNVTFNAASSSNPSTVWVADYATGGGGGNVNPPSGVTTIQPAAAGTALAQTNVTAINNVYASASATGYGSGGTSAIMSALDGSAVTADASGVSTGPSGYAVAIAEAKGSAGGAVIGTGKGYGGYAGSTSAQATAQNASAANNQSYGGLSNLSVVSVASVVAGDGGYSQGSGYSGQTGGSATDILASGISTGGGNVYVAVSGTGGVGGSGLYGALGGNGGREILTNVPTGSTIDGADLYLTQNAIGGAGGYSTTTGGNGGAAESTLSLASDTANENVILAATASGGAGGNTAAGGSETGGGGMAIADVSNSSTEAGAQSFANATAGTSGVLNVLGLSSYSSSPLKVITLANGSQAIADATATSVNSEGAVVASANALAGSGAGFVTPRPNYNGVQNYGIGVGGYGGNGGTAIAMASAGGASGTASAPNTTDGINTADESVVAIAQATGGNGGEGAGNTGKGNQISAGNGGMAVIGTINSSGTFVPGVVTGTSSDGGNVLVAATLTGGNGGYGAWGADGGSGGSEVITNIVNGSTTGQLTLEQTAIGGSAGGTFDGSTGGSPGEAISNLNITFSPTSPVIPSVLTGVSTAIPGNGGAENTTFDNNYTPSGNPQAGPATAAVSLTNVYSVKATANAGNGQESGASNIDYYVVGGGNYASANASAVSTGVGYAEAFANAIGSNGGNKSSTIAAGGSYGGNATAQASATNASAPNNLSYNGINDLSVIAIANAVGGTGLVRGGGATVTSVSGVSSSGGNVYVLASVTGGNGSYSGATGSSGQGGAASIINAVSGSTTDGATLRLTQIATGGNGGSISLQTANGGEATDRLNFTAGTTNENVILTTQATGGNYGTGGSAIAVTHGVSGGGSIDSIAIADAGLPSKASTGGYVTPAGIDSAAATAQTSAGAVNVEALASLSGIGHSADAEAAVNVGGQPILPASISSSRQAAAFATAVPDQATISALYANTSNFAVSGGAYNHVLGVTTLSGHAISGTPGLNRNSETTWTISPGQLASSEQELLLGYEGASYTGTGAVDFQVTQDGNPLINQQFTNFGQAASYFNNQTVDLGSMSSTAAVGGTTALNVSMDVVGGTAGSSFTVNSMAVTNAVSASSPIAAGGKYAGYSVVRDFGNNDRNTDVQFLGGTASTSTTLAVSFSSAPTTATNLISDIVNISGTNSDRYVLQLSYNPSLVTNGALSPVLAWKMANGSWVAAYLGDQGSSAGTEINGAYVAGSGAPVGTYGIDTAAHTVWAVLNYSGSSLTDPLGQFAVMQRTPGDTNGDGTVNLQDFLTLKSNFGTTDQLWSQGNFLGTSTINLQDFLTLKANFGSGATLSSVNSYLTASTATPEPAAVLLLLGGASILMLKRRRAASSGQRGLWSK